MHELYDKSFNKRIYITLQSVEKGNELLDQALFYYLCYKYNSSIKSIQIVLEMPNQKKVFFRNEYYNYTISEIKKDLQQLTLMYYSDSDAVIQITSEHFVKLGNNGKKILGSKMYIAININISKGLFIDEDEMVSLPCEYNSTLFDNLLYYNDYGVLRGKNDNIEFLNNLISYKKDEILESYVNLVSDYRYIIKKKEEKLYSEESNELFGLEVKLYYIEQSISELQGKGIDVTSFEEEKIKVETEIETFKQNSKLYKIKEFEKNETQKNNNNNNVFTDINKKYIWYFNERGTFIHIIINQK